MKLIPKSLKFLGYSLIYMDMTKDLDIICYFVTIGISAYACRMHQPILGSAIYLIFLSASPLVFCVKKFSVDAKLLLPTDHQQ